MVTAPTLEGIIDRQVSFHYDLTADVLYLRLLDQPQNSTIGEDTRDELVLFRDEQTDEVVGLDIISWWKRFGDEMSTDSIAEIAGRIELFARRLVAEASLKPQSSRATLS